MVYSKNPQSPKLKYPFQSLEARDFEAAHLIFCCLKHIRLPLIEAFLNYGVDVDSPKWRPPVSFLSPSNIVKHAASLCTWPWVGFSRGGRVSPPKKKVPKIADAPRKIAQKLGKNPQSLDKCSDSKKTSKPEKKNKVL